ncbi:hypothetical protein KAI68_07305 [bacterium]|nr:hypothetical protein [bacterium]
MNRCTKCILPENYPDITFNEKGVCNVCHNYKLPVLKGEESLLNILKDKRKTDGSFDCIVPFSGGRESTYILYKVKKDYDMHPLAVQYDNEFVSQQAWKNIENAVKKLDVKFISLKSQKNLRKKLVADSIRIVIDKGLKEISAKLCTHCWIGQESSVYKIAKQYNIPLILWGDSSDEQTPLGQIPTNIKPFFSVERFKKLKVIFSSELFSYLRIKYNSFQMKKEFKGPRSISPNVSSGLLHIFDYIEHNETEIVETIKKNLDWDKPADVKLPWRFDCVLGQLVMYFQRKTYGFCKNDVGLSNMIRKGIISRNEALKFVTTDNEEEELKKALLILKQIGLTEKEVYKIELLLKADNKIC